MSIPPEEIALARMVHDAAANLNFAIRLAAESGFKLNVEVKWDDAAYPSVYTTTLKNGHLSWLKKDGVDEGSA